MQIRDERGINYISHMTWDERAELLNHLKTVKLYDIIYLTPNEANTVVCALRSSSIFTMYDIPVVLPGCLCVDGPTFINSVSSYNGILDSNKQIIMSPDIEFPCIDDCLGKYMYINLITDGGKCIIDESRSTVIVPPSYHMIPKINNVYAVINEYKYNASNNGIVEILPDDVTSVIVDRYRSLKAGDGAVICSINKTHLITLFAGLFPLNKSDSIELKLFDNPLDNKFLLQATITKKKQNPIVLHMFLLRV